MNDLEAMKQDFRKILTKNEDNETNNLLIAILSGPMFVIGVMGLYIILLYASLFIDGKYPVSRINFTFIITILGAITGFIYMLKTSLVTKYLIYILKRRLNHEFFRSDESFD